MGIFQTTLKRILRNPSSIILTFIVPIFFIVIVILLFSQKSTLQIELKDQDNSSVSKAIINEIKHHDVFIQSSPDPIKRVQSGKCDMYIIIPSGYEDDIIQCKNKTSLKIYTCKNTQRVSSLRLVINNYIDSLKNIADSCSKSKEAFYEGLDFFTHSPSQVTYVASSIPCPLELHQSLGILSMFLLYSAINFSILIQKDRGLRITKRVFASPLGRVRYVLENALAYLTLSVIQLSLVLFFITYIFKSSTSGKYISLFAFYLIYAFMCICLAILINTLSRNESQAQWGGFVIVLIMSMLGGALWPIDIMPENIQKLSEFIPISWAISGGTAVIENLNVSYIFPYILNLLIVSIGSILISINAQVKST